MDVHKGLGTNIYYITRVHAWGGHCRCAGAANSHVHFVVHFCFSFPAERPKLYLSLTPTISIAIGITSALLIGGCAILIGLRLSKCQNHPRHHHHHQQHRQNNGQSDAQRSLKITSKPILYNGSPGSSNKSGGGSHKDDDGEGDEKNPDVIPDSSEEQVSSSNGRRRRRRRSRKICGREVE